MASTSGAIFNGTSRFSGDFQSVIARAVGIASLPIAQLNAAKNTIANQTMALNALDSKFNFLQTAIQTLQTTAGSGSLSSSLSIPGIVQTSISTGATEGSYSIEVTNLGSFTNTLSLDGLTAVSDPSQQNISSSSDYTLALNGATTVVHPAGTSLNALAAAINSQTSLSVQASVVNIGSPSAPDYRLSLQSTKLGATTVQLNDGTKDLLSTVSTGTLATYKVNGLGISSSSDSRTITLAPGLTVSLLAQSATGVATSITVSRSGSAFSNGLSSFVNAYNNAVDELAKSRGTSPGPLAGQSIIASLSSTLRQVLNYSTGASGISSLTSLGISSDKTGHLSLDTNAFTTATTGQFTALLTFLGSSTGPGFLQHATQALNSVEDLSTGSLKTTLSSLATQSANEDALITKQQDRVDRLQRDLQARFAAADALIASMEQQVTYFNGLFQAFSNSQQSGH